MKERTIAFLTTSHLPFDDRIYYSMAISLSKSYNIVIVATTQNIREISGNINVCAEDKADFSKTEKIDFFLNQLKAYRPGVIICSEPLPIIAAYKYKRKEAEKVSILYDITEWYPSKKQLIHESFPAKIYVFFKLLFFNLFASCFVDGFIFGERYKSLPYRLAFPLKKWALISYYPNLDFIKFVEASLNPKHVCLGYTGKISLEKGIKNVWEVAKTIKLKRPELEVKVKVIGWFGDEKEEKIFNQLISTNNGISVELLGRQDFITFSETLKDIDIFLDLRKIDLENSRCLPIKLYYYIACGRPVIYSNLKAIRKEIEVNQFGYLVKPNNADLISNYILNYIDHSDIFLKHSHRARELALNNYNWRAIEPAFLNYIQKFQN